MDGFTSSGNTLLICSAFSLNTRSKPMFFKKARRRSDSSFTTTSAPHALGNTAKPPIPADGSRTTSESFIFAAHAARNAMLGGVENCWKLVCSSVRFVCVGSLSRIDCSLLTALTAVLTSPLKFLAAESNVLFTASSIASYASFTVYVPSAIVPPYALSANSNKRDELNAVPFLISLSAMAVARASCGLVTVACFSILLSVFPASPCLPGSSP